MPMPSAPTSNARPQRLVGELLALFEDVSGTELEGVDPGANFVELGLDSLSLTQVALQLQKTYALKITFRELMDGCSSFERLAAHIDRLLPAEAQPVAPAPAAMPAPVAAAAPVAMAMGGGLVQDVIAQQMQIMREQLALLAGAAAPASAFVGAASAAIASLPQAPIAAEAAPTQSSPGGSTSDEEAALAHTTYDVKKAFGAIARIHSRRDRTERSPACAARRLHAPLYRAHENVQGLYRRAPRPSGRSPRRQRLPSAVEGDRLSDRHRALQGLEGVGHRRQRLRRRAQRLRHEPVRLAARLRARRGAQAAGCGLRDRPAASARRRSWRNRSATSPASTAPPCAIPAPKP
jgi:acyl carrier protein